MKKWLLVIILSVIYEPIYGFRVNETWFSSNNYLNTQEYDKEEKRSSLIELFLKANKINFSLIECGGYYGWWNYGRKYNNTWDYEVEWYWLIELQVLKTDFSFRKINMSGGLIEMSTGLIEICPPFFMIGIIPISFSFNFPYNIFLKIKSSAFSMWMVSHPCDIAYGILFYHFGEWGKFTPMRLRFIFARIGMGKELTQYFGSSRIFVKGLPEIKLAVMREFEGSVHRLTYSILLGIEVGIGRRLK